MATGYILLVTYALHLNGLSSVPESMFMSQRFTSEKTCKAAGEWILENQKKVTFAGNNGKAVFTCLPE